MKTRKSWIQGEYDGTDIYSNESKSKLIGKIENELDAQLIVRAVNSHLELIDALENAVEDLNIDGTFTSKELLKTIEAVRKNMRDAIAKAEGK